MRLISWCATQQLDDAELPQGALGSPRIDGRDGGPASTSAALSKGPWGGGKGDSALLLRASVLAVAGSGNGRVAVTAPSRLSANMISRCVTVFKTNPGAMLAPTLKVFGGCLSIEISAAPWPEALAITPIARKRSVGISAAPTNVARGAPSRRASSTAVPATTDTGARASATEVALPVASTARVQYPTHNNADPSKTAAIKRRLDSVSKFDMTPASSAQASRYCKRDRGWFVRGFTLIELMVVLVIIGVLAALIVPNVLDRADDARVSAARVDVNNLMQALKLYRLDNQRYPTAEQGLRALVQRPDKSPVPTNWKAYIDKLPNDPWGQPYVYLNPGVKADIDVMSYGADGKSGGEGKDADIGSWQ
jgi:general secretion pathway protein G